MGRPRTPPAHQGWSWPLIAEGLPKKPPQSLSSPFRYSRRLLKEPSHQQGQPAATTLGQQQGGALPQELPRPPPPKKKKKEITDPPSSTLHVPTCAPCEWLRTRAPIKCASAAAPIAACRKLETQRKGSSCQGAILLPGFFSHLKQQQQKNLFCKPCTSSYLHWQLISRRGVQF